MTATDFVDKLKVLSPSREALDLRGYKGIHNDAIWNEYNIARKEKTFKETGNPVIDLMENYEMESRGISNITFDTIYDHEDYIGFGSTDVFLLVIDKKTGMINTLDISDDYSFHTECAKDAGSFLDAIVIAMEYHTKILKGEMKLTTENSEYYRNLCATAAGGTAFYAFYFMLIW